MKPETAMTPLAFFTNERPDLLDRLNRSNLVVRHHYTNQNGVWSDRSAEIFHANDAVVINRQACYFPTARLKFFNDSAHRWMFNRRSDDVFAVTLRGFADSANRKVVSFRSAGREDDLVRPRPD